MTAAVYTRQNVKLREWQRGTWGAQAGGRRFAVLKLGGVWVVFADGVEKFSAARLEVAHDKIVDLLNESPG